LQEKLNKIDLEQFMDESLMWVSFEAKLDMFLDTEHEDIVIPRMLSETLHYFLKNKGN